MKTRTSLTGRFRVGGVMSVILSLCLLAVFMTARMVSAQATPPEAVGETSDTVDTAERIRVLEAQKIRQDERASLFGGTGLVFTRTAVLLPRKHFNVSTYFNWSSYQYVQGWRTAYTLDDPRQNDYEMNVVADYGLTHYMELSGFVNLFLEDENSDSDQLHMRQMGIGWTGVNAKFRIMDIDKDGLGIAATVYTRAPSPMQSADITSDDFGYGVELNVSLKLMVVTQWLEKVTIHGNFGYGHFDYFDTGLAGLYQFVRGLDPSQRLQFATRQDKYRGDYKFTDLFDPSWTPDDYEMENLWFATDHYTGSFAMEYKPVIGMSVGFELYGYRMIRFSDDNLQFAPFVTYTFRQVPFVKAVHRQIFTATLAGNLGGLRSQNRSSPQYGIVLGLTYHTDLIF